MTKQIIAFAVIASLFFTACQNNSKKNDNIENKNSVIKEKEDQAKDITFTVAKNYFVKNTVQKLDNPKIETSEKFAEIFGMATTMGNDGKPTEIDFSKQYVIAVVMPETDMMTTVEPVSLQKNTKGDVILIYKSVIGEKQSYTTRPNFAIIVDKTENGNVILKEIK